MWQEWYWEETRKKETIIKETRKKERVMSKEREKEKKRESTSGKDRKRSNLNTLIEYNETETVSEEILITEPIEMAPYYRELLKKYLYNLEKENAK